MNKVVLMGRLTRDPEVREGEKPVARFSIAVSRRFKNAEGQYEADFINCVAFNKGAEFIQKYFHKGDMIAVTGRIQTGSYVNKDGVTVYTTDVIVEETDFCGSKNDGNQTPAGNSGNDFMSIPNVSDEELPFN